MRKIKRWGHVENEKDYEVFPYERLFHPLGMSTAIIEPDASGTFVGSSFMYASARDWAKFGLLYLNDGVWNNQRILPERQIAKKTYLSNIRLVSFFFIGLLPLY